MMTTLWTNLRYTKWPPLNIKFPGDFFRLIRTVEDQTVTDARGTIAELASVKFATRRK